MLDTKLEQRGRLDASPLGFDAFPLVTLTSKFSATSLWSGVVSRIWSISELILFSPLLYHLSYLGIRDIVGFPYPSVKQVYSWLFNRRLEQGEC